MLKTLQVTADAAPGFIRDIGADKVEFKFRKPKSIKIGGSYAFQGIAKPDVNVDLLVGLPKVLHDYCPTYCRFYHCNAAVYPFLV